MVILDLKLSGREKGQSRIFVSIVDLEADKLVIIIISEQIRPWYEAQLSEKQNEFRKS